MAPSFASSMFNFIRKFINYDTPSFLVQELRSYRSIYTSTMLSLCIIIHIPMTFFSKYLHILVIFPQIYSFPPRNCGILFCVFTTNSLMAFPMNMEYSLVCCDLSRYHQIWIDDLEFYRLSFLFFLFTIDEFRKRRDYIILKKKKLG